MHKRMMSNKSGQEFKTKKWGMKAQSLNQWESSWSFFLRKLTVQCEKGHVNNREPVTQLDF